MVHLYKFLFTLSLFSIFSAKPVLEKDKLYFRLGNDYYNGYKFFKKRDFMKSLYCYDKKSIIFEKLGHSLGDKEFVFSKGFFELKMENLLHQDNFQVFLNFLRLEKISNSVALRIKLEERKALIKKSNASKCFKTLTLAAKAAISVYKMEKFLMNRFNFKAKSEKQGPQLKSLVQSLENQYELELYK